LGVDINHEEKSALMKSCLHGNLEIVKWLYDLNPNLPAEEINNMFLKSCESGIIELAQWVYSLCVNIPDYSDIFRCCCEEGDVDIAKWLYSIDKTVLFKTIRDIGNIDLQDLGVRDESILLFECIRNGDLLPQIYDIEDEVIIPLVHYNMVSHLETLREQFTYINFDVVDGKVTDFRIDRPTKSARNN